jgi:hypothetical protein
MVFRYDENVTSRPPYGTDSDVDLGPPEEREGHETLLPSVTRSVLSMKIGSYSVADLGVEQLATPDPDDSRARGARSGDVIGGRYIVEGQLGRGGMGRVMRVRHQALGKVFALKLIKSTIATNPKIREMFYREARLASALTHENICSIVDFGQDEAFGLFMVMELLDGQTAHQKLRQSGRLSPKVACDIMWQIADAVRFIHSRAILHGARLSRCDLSTADLTDADLALADLSEATLPQIPKVRAAGFWWLGVYNPDYAAKGRYGVEALKTHPDPSLVQDYISRARRRIAKTPPEAVGERAIAFDHAKAPPRPPRNSVEAVGGTADEAARDHGD